MERARLKDFNPDKIAPNFLRFLHQLGPVEIGRESKEVKRYGLSYEEEPQEGLEKPVILNGQVIGTLEYYINPPVVLYEGKLPNVPPKQKNPQPFSQPTVDESGTEWRHVFIHYHGDHPKAETKGRGDGWISIPLP